MSSRRPIDRVYTAMAGGTPDRVPVVPKIWVDLAANLTGTDFCAVLEDPRLALSVIAEAGLQVGADAVRQFHFPARRIERRGGEVVEIAAGGRLVGRIDIEGGWATHLEDPSEFDVEDPYRMAYHTYWTHREVPFLESVADARRIVVPKKAFWEELGCGDRQRETAREYDSRIGLLGDLNSATLAFHVCMRGLERAMFDLTEQPDLVHASMEKGAAIAIERGRFVLDLGMRILRLNDSVGNMSLISPDHWREYVKPHMRDVCTELHAYDPAARIYCHICGNVTPILDDLVEIGIDCIAPLDPLGEVRPSTVREQLGPGVALMGGVDTLSFLNATPEAIEAEARACMSEAGRSGAYLLGSGCVVPRAAPAENLAALRWASDRYGIYSEGRLTDAEGTHGEAPV